MMEWDKKLNVIKNFYNWLAEFFKTQFGLFLFFCSLIFGGVWYADSQRENGKLEGRAYSEVETRALKNEVKKDSIELEKKKLEINYLIKVKDSCQNINSTENLNKEVLRRLDEADRMKQQFQQRISTIDKYQRNIDNQIKSKQ